MNFTLPKISFEAENATCVPPAIQYVIVGNFPVSGDESTNIAQMLGVRGC